MSHYKLEQDINGIRLKNFYSSIFGNEYAIPHGLSDMLDPSRENDRITNVNVCIDSKCNNFVEEACLDIPICDFEGPFYRVTSYVETSSSININFGLSFEDTSLSTNLNLNVLSTGLVGGNPQGRTERQVVPMNISSGVGLTNIRLSPRDAWVDIFMTREICGLRVTYLIRLLIITTDGNRDITTDLNTQYRSEFHRYEFALISESPVDHVQVDNQDIIISPSLLDLSSFGTDVYNVKTSVVTNAKTYTSSSCIFIDDAFKLKCTINNSINNKVLCSEKLSCNDIECMIMYEALSEADDCNKCDDMCKLLECVKACVNDDCNC